MHGLIGGKTTALLIAETTKEKNEFGEWIGGKTVTSELFGWLDLMGGGSAYQMFNAKIQDSTHIFIADYKELPAEFFTQVATLEVGGHEYDVTLIDDPMGMHEQLEIYLRYRGAMK